MTKSQKNDAVGDTLSPPLQQDAESLHYAVDQGLHIPAEAAPKPVPVSKIGNLSDSLKGLAACTSAPGSCVQTLWFSFFFDGTGNNLDADVGTLKHSNVTRLYRAHKDNDSITGIYRFYIPGVGTYFKDIGDKGGTALGGGAGDMGTERIEWAFNQFDEKMKAHIARAHNLSNAIVEINLAAFGFSRGAALARAFIHRFVAQRCRQDTKNHWRLMPGGYPLRIRFMGLFDTVASVGMPMSANTTSLVGTMAGSVSYMINTRLHDTNCFDTRPDRLAFAAHAHPGADPAPGRYNGHMRWGDDMRIPDMVEEVQHFVAAHELRNSFPLDSVSVLQHERIYKPPHFIETVYPGVHSDLGGSYRPGEGARSERFDQKLGLIPLRDMYNRAVAKGVPLLPETAWQKRNTDDFSISPAALADYAYYLSKATAPSTLGDLFNAHMALYYAWRFRAIRRKEQGDHHEKDLISKNDAIYKKEEDALNKEIGILETENNAAMKKLVQAQTARNAYVMNSYGNPNIKEGLARHDQNVADATSEYVAVQDNLLRAKARLEALPKPGCLENMIEMYDRQLLADARAIYEVYTRAPVGRTKADPAVREALRPHYKAMMTAYENEYVFHQGLNDEKIIAFFDTYVHDSLAGFAKDATLPSDPRVIYLGGNEKYQYAMQEQDEVEPIYPEDAAA
jgi:hypothetical protein